MHQVLLHLCGKGLNELVRVETVDDPDPTTKADFKYEIMLKVHNSWEKTARLVFHRGEVTETGPNGLTNEALLAVVIDRLQGFNNGPFKCRENSLAITKLEEALHWLQSRTIERDRRGVDGKLVP